MTVVTLSDLDFIPFLDQHGLTSDDFNGKVGVYAIFNQAQRLQYVGYSRDIALSLKQHLVRQPQSCYWLKVQTIERPNRTVLEEIRAAWIAENGEIPAGNAADAEQWNQPIDAKTRMTTAEQSAYANSDDLGRVKTLKQVARRVEAEVLAALKTRGVKLDLRFDPKAKEQGLLDLK
jgi:hypothetical protein